MDIAPDAICRISPNCLFYIPKKKHPDKLMEDWLHQTGEFSLSIELAFEKHLRWAKEHKKRQKDYAHNRMAFAAVV